MILARQGATATLLPTGKVLVAGGFGDASGAASGDASAELYDPRTGTWSRTASMHVGRCRHSATLLHTGKVLVIGDASPDCNGALTQPASDADVTELYDSRTGVWTRTGSLHVARAGFSTTLLADGRVLVAGGIDTNGQLLSSTELYNPRTGQWLRTSGNMITGRAYHSAVLLRSGEVLIVGGCCQMEGYQTPIDACEHGACKEVATAELFNPRTSTWHQTHLYYPTGRDDVIGPTPVLLPNGKVLFVGTNSAFSTDPLSCELYDPITGKWTATEAVPTWRERYIVVALRSGEVLVAGGDDGTPRGESTSAYLYEWQTGQWISAGRMSNAHVNGAGARLSNGRILVAGGANFPNSTPITTAEILTAP